MDPVRSLDPTSSTGEPAARRRYPTLELIDPALASGIAPFANDPNAQSLERFARELADQYWPEHVWLTGLVSPTQLAAVVGPLDEERERSLDAIRLLVAAETANADLPNGPRTR